MENQRKMKLIDDAWSEFKRVWSIRVALIGVAFWSAVAGLIMVWPAFIEVIPLWGYALGGIVLSVAFGVARFLKQPGAKDE